MIEQGEIKITEKEENKIKEFPLSGGDYRDIPIKDKLKIMKNITNDMLVHTKRELVDYFTFQEVELLINIRSIYLYKSNMSAKNFLIENIEDELKQINTRKDFEQTTILEKIYKITEFQAYTIITMCFEFFNTTIKPEEYVYMLIKIFQITGEVKTNSYLQYEPVYQFTSYLLNKEIATSSDCNVSIAVSDMLAHTKTKLVNYFTIEEAKLICSITNGYLYQSNLAPKMCVIGNTEDGIKYENLDIEYNVDKKIILDKLHRLTEFESFTVLTMGFEFWGTPDDRYEDFIGTIKRIFQITEVNTVQ